MGFWNGVGDRVRNLMRWDKEQIQVSLAKGSSTPGASPSGFDLLQSYGFDQLSDYLRIDSDLMTRYAEYEDMDEEPLISSAIDVYADDATQSDSLHNRTMWVDSADKTVQTILTTLFDRRLRIEEEIWEIARGLIKYGSAYEELLVTGDGVVGLNYLPPPTMRRIEGRRGELFGFIQDFRGKFNHTPAEFKQLLANRQTSAGALNDNYAALEDWEVCHMRLRSKHRRSLYGYSVLEPARHIFKRLNLLEDAALIYRLQRAPQRYAFYIDIGDLPPKEAFAYLNKIRQQYKKNKFINSATGKLDFRLNPLGQDEDFFVPVRKGIQQTKIEVLGTPAWQSMEDINYFQDKLFAALKVPKIYLGSSESRAKGVLSQEDVRFARTVLRIQRELRNGMRKVSRVHLAALGIDPSRVDYDILMTVPSSIFELAQLEVRNAKADFAARMSQFVSLHWILQKVFGLSDEEITRVIKEKQGEQVADAKVQAHAQSFALDVQNQAQLQAQQQAAQLAPPAPAGAAAKESVSRQAPSRMSTQVGQQLPFRSITEKELFAGNREHEKRMEDNLDKILSQGNGMSSRINGLGKLLNEIRLASPRR